MDPADTPPPRIWKMGDCCQLRAGETRKEALVLLASTNGRSLAFSFTGLFRVAGGFHVGGIALLWDGKAFRDLKTEAVVEVEERPHGAN
jgi:hypothetical protein